MATEVNRARVTGAGRKSLSDVHPLTDSCEPEVLRFLSERFFHTFGLLGLLMTNGVTSPDLRGTFYACRGEQGALEGVALIGHSNLFETRTSSALRAFARLTRLCDDAALVLGEQEEVANFWAHYQEYGPAESVAHQEVLLELRGNPEPSGAAPGLRPARLEDLEQVVWNHSQIALHERGVNPLDVEADAFRRRCARRIELGRTWLLEERGKHIFKAEIVFATPRVTYLESIAVHPEERGKGYGMRCLAQLAEQLLTRSESICVLVQQRNQRALNFYKKVGFTPVANYRSLLLDRRLIREV